MLPSQEKTAREEIEPVGVMFHSGKGPARLLVEPPESELTVLIHRQPGSPEPFSQASKMLVKSDAELDAATPKLRAFYKNQNEIVAGLLSLEKEAMSDEAKGAEGVRLPRAAST
jgi:hypothetical protein